MMGRAKKLLTNLRFIIFLIFLVFMLVAIRPSPWNEGVVIKSVMKNSSAAAAGMESPKPDARPLSREVIKSIDNRPVSSLQEYSEIIGGLRPNQTFQIRTSKGLYRLQARQEYQIVFLNETEEITVPETIEANETINGTVVAVNRTIQKKVVVEKTEQIPVGVEDIGLRVDNAPKTNLRKGLDLQGGTRVLLKPAEPVSAETIGTMIDSLKERLNVYGVSDIVVAPVQDKPDFLGEPERFILVEIAGATEEEVRELLSRQGKFEATIANTTVFRGGNDITYVCRTAECSGLDPHAGCGQGEGGHYCRFMFSISLSPEAAQRQADATKNLEVVRKDSEKYLSEQLRLFLDDQEVDALQIADDLKGRAVTDIAISGSGFGTTRDRAMQATLENMKRLQTILITGSLPVRLEIVRIDTISPTLGARFLNNAWLAGLLALAGVVLILGISYRRIKIALPIALTSATEVLLAIGVYSFLGWSFDLAAIAGLIVAVGTGVNDQIIIMDETLRREAAEQARNWKEKIRKAFVIIFSAYCTAVVAMLPLLFAGAGLLKGFALTTIIVVSIGVFITRPAYAAAIQILYEE